MCDVPGCCIVSGDFNTKTTACMWTCGCVIFLVVVLLAVISIQRQLHVGHEEVSQGCALADLLFIFCLYQSRVIRHHATTVVYQQDE